MARFDKKTTLKIQWSKKYNDLVISYPNNSGSTLGYNISDYIINLIKKDYSECFDITTFKCTIKVTPEEEQRLQKMYEEGMVFENKLY